MRKSIIMSEIDKIVAFNVLMRMRELELDQKTLAKKAKVTAAYLNKLVKNKKSISKSPKLPDIAKALNIDETKLYIHPRHRLHNLATRLSLAMKDTLRKNNVDESFRANAPSEIAENWQAAGLTRQLLALFFVTGKNQYKEHLASDVKSRLEDFVRSLGPTLLPFQKDQ